MHRSGKGATATAALIVFASFSACAPSDSSQPGGSSSAADAPTLGADELRRLIVMEDRSVAAIAVEQLEWVGGGGIIVALAGAGAQNRIAEAIRDAGGDSYIATTGAAGVRAATDADWSNYGKGRQNR